MIMKRFLLLFVALAILVASIPVSAEKQTFEMWTESPYITSGITTTDLEINNAIQNGTASIYKLGDIGSNMYLFTTYRTVSDGTIDFYYTCYVVLLNGNSRIVISKAIAPVMYTYSYTEPAIEVYTSNNTNKKYVFHNLLTIDANGNFYPYTSENTVSKVYRGNFYNIGGGKYVNTYAYTKYNATDNKDYYTVGVKLLSINSSGVMSIENEYSVDTYKTASGSSDSSDFRVAFGGVDLKTLALNDAMYSSTGAKKPKFIVGERILVYDDQTIGIINFNGADKATDYNLCTYNGDLGFVYTVANYGNGDINIKKFVVINNVLTWTEIIPPFRQWRNTKPYGLEGYYSYNSGFYPCFYPLILGRCNSTWFGSNYSNVFSDGRTVNLSFANTSNSSSELWYTVTNRSGIVCGKGATGYSYTSGTAINAPTMNAYVVNDSKFIAYNQTYNFLKEYYRVAIVEETTTGEIVSGGGIGTKNITPPITADTIPINPQINFAENDLPLGYNLNPTLKSDINTIILPDIVLVKKVGYISGVTNTGQTLDSFSNYDYGFGASYIRFYTNGSNLQWYCYNPELLTVGTYNKSFVIGSKTIYIKVKVIAPPTNNSVTAVVF